MALRVALIGCGPLGRRYAELIAATGSTVLVAFDAERDASEEFADQTGARLAPTLDDAVTAIGVEAIVVCLDGDERLAAIDAAAEARRHVFDAMPLHAEAVTALHRVGDAGAAVGVDLRLRHDSGIREVADVARGGEIGEIRSCSIVVRDDATSSEESMVHDLDLARYLTGSDIVDVSGLRGPSTMMMLLTHMSGAITSIERTQVAVAGEQALVELAGTTGTVSSEPTLRAGATVRTAEGDHRHHRTANTLERSLSAQWVAFVNAVCDGESTEDVNDARTALYATQAAQTALTERRTVDIADFLPAS